MKPDRWKNPANKLFPYQVGFTAPPHDFDAAPSDFLRISPETVGVHGRMLHVPEQVPDADAIVINGMPNWRRADGLPQRTVSRVDEMESITGKQVVSSDFALYWNTFKSLGITSEHAPGRLLSSLK